MVQLGVSVETAARFFPASGVRWVDKERDTNARRGCSNCFDPISLNKRYSLTDRCDVQDSFAESSCFKAAAA